jgi:hypothetical protein
MNWQAWKRGLMVAAFTGLLGGICAYQIADKIKWDNFVIFLLISAAKDMLLFLKSNPVEKLPVQLTIPLCVLALALLPGCANFSTVQTDVSYESYTNGTRVVSVPARSITTRVSASTLGTSKSELAKFTALQTDKTQSAKVGNLAQQTSGTNAVKALGDLRRILELLGGMP